MSSAYTNILLPAPAARQTPMRRAPEPEKAPRKTLAQLAAARADHARYVARMRLIEPGRSPRHT